MKITLAFQVYNREQWIEPVLDSWITHLSGKHEYEVIIVFDDCKDRSVEIAHRYLREKKCEYVFLFADNRYELFCNNLALRYATGDYVIFIQDDNWIYDKDWDLLLEEVLSHVNNIGGISFLAGVKMLPDPKKINLKRIEIDRPHKKEYFAAHNLPDYELGVWRVDSITRPFCISRQLLLSCGGLDDAFSPACGDDLDLGLKLLKQGKVNIYIPFDILNVVGSKETLTHEFRRAIYEQAYTLNYERHHKYIMEREDDSVQLLIPLAVAKDGRLIVSAGRRQDVSGVEIPGAISFTLFAMPKPFTKAFALIQENAIRSWMNLKPRPEIILFGNDDGVAEFAQKHNLKHICDVQRNEFGTPLVNDLFLKAQRIAANEICVYVNTDIILMDDFAAAIEKVGKRFEQFLMIGRRWDFDILEKIRFDDEGWQQQLRQRVFRNGYYHEPTGIDYFAFTKGLWGDIPPFAIGRSAWDNWLVDTAVTSQYPVVDASQGAMIIHQNHDFSHISGGKDSESFKVEERRNRELAPHTYYTGFTTQAIWKLTPENIELKSVDEFLQNENLSMALRCIDMAYQHTPEVVKRQYEEFAAQARPDDLAGLSSAARTELMSGSATNAAKLVLGYTDASNQISAAEMFRKGFEYLRDGDAAEALKYLDKAAVNFAGLPNLYFAIATAYAQLGDLASARKACQIELSLHPENAGAEKLLRRIEKTIDECRANRQLDVCL